MTGKKTNVHFAYEQQHFDKRQAQLGFATNGSNSMKVCVVSPGINLYSETFVNNHVNRLPLDTVAACGHAFSLNKDGKKWVSDNAFSAVFNGIRRRAIGRSWVADWNVRVFNSIKKSGADVVLAEYGPTAVKILPGIVKNDLPLVVHFHGHDAYVKETIEKYLDSYQTVFAVAKKIVAVSADMKEQLISLGAAADKIAVIPCGADERLFGETDKERAKPVLNVGSFLSVGRFVDKKAPHLTILAFYKMLSEYPSAKLTMVGDGPLLSFCQQLVEGLEIGDAVALRGVLPQEEVAKLMQSTAVFVQHSVTASNGDSEGTPVSVMEAQISGTAVVATAHCGIKDVVKHNETGLLVEEGDVHGMAAAMLRLARDPEEALRFGRAARSNAIKEYSLQKSLSSLAAILQAATKKA